jgi:alkaline phosphatase
MSLRLKILCLLVLAAFASLAFAYYKFYVVRKTHGVILFIVPGLNLELLNQSGIDPETGAGSPPRLTRASQVALVSNQTESGKTNPAALLSYLATGSLGLPDQIGLSPSGRRQDNLFYAAQRANRAIGFATNSRIDNPVVAAFYAHQTSAEDRPRIAQQLLDSTDITVMLGELSPSFETLKQTTGRDLLAEAETRGIRVVRTADELNEVSPWWTLRYRLLGLFRRPLPPAPPVPEPTPAKTAQSKTKTPPEPTPPPPEEPIPPFPSLTQLVTQSINVLQYNWRGYFLVIHADLRDPNDPSVRTKDVIDHIREVSRAVQAARDWAGKNSTVILYVPYDLPAIEDKPVPPPAPRPATSSRRKSSPTAPPPAPPPPYPTLPAGFGWAAFYGNPVAMPQGFLTAEELHNIIRAQF